jgi:hypothetical protein
MGTVGNTQAHPAKSSVPEINTTAIRTFLEMFSENIWLKALSSLSSKELRGIVYDRGE